MQRPGSTGTVDLNADLGEEVTDDEGLLAVVTSANVACGFHAGTVETMRAVCAGAVLRGVTLGAQVSYDDRARFGRVELDVPADLLRQQVAEQVGTLAAIAAAEGGEVAYVKPHGALYHRVARDEEQAAAVLDGSGELPVLGMPGSLLLSMARQRGRGSRLEGFPDRGYGSDGRLLPRDRCGPRLPYDVRSRRPARPSSRAGPPQPEPTAVEGRDLAVEQWTTSVGNPVGLQVCRADPLRAAVRRT
jgi:UPF0271 protein